MSYHYCHLMAEKQKLKAKEETLDDSAQHKIKLKLEEKKDNPSYKGNSSKT